MALWSDLADTIVASVTHDDVAVPIHCDSTRKEKLRNGPFSVSMARYAGWCPVDCGMLVLQ
jgi:hypothetical protein